MPVPPISATTASDVTQESEHLYRAAWVLGSARRVTRDLRAGKVPDVARERDYFQRHQDAVAKRRAAGVAVDAAAAEHGSELGWYAKMDARTTEECRLANGCNFTIDKRPPMGYPGSVHVNCRCKAGPPHRTTRTVYSVKKVA